MHNTPIWRLTSLLLWSLGFGGLGAFAPAHAQFPAGGRLLESSHHHLGQDPLEQPWPEAPARPAGAQLEVRFESKANPREWVLAIRQRDVSERTSLLLNGREIAALKINKDPHVFFYPVAAGQLKNGENQLSVVPTKPRDNMIIGPIQLYEQRLPEFLPMRPVTVSVKDVGTGKPVPARVTVTDLSGNLVEVFNADPEATAVRIGTLYTHGTGTTVDLPHGDYILHATRGMEWSRAEARISIRDQPAGFHVPLTIRREFDTTGFIATDTHVHTFTYSGHGDANLDERVLTLAGEGVELAIATDHNHNTDFRPYQQRNGLNPYYTSVTGNEVSTVLGHINGFPLDPRDDRPDPKLSDWVQLVDDIRAKGARVVILNHPRSPALATSPFSRAGLNRASGEFASGTSFPFDAMELNNPGGARPDPLYLFRDWFALLNHGEKVTAVGSSDSHTVDDPVGWGRTYVPSTTDDPARIDVDDACDRFLRGEVSVALGIFTDIRVDGRYTMGETYSPKRSSVDVRLRVAAPSWVRPRRGIVYLNGQPVMEKPVPQAAKGATDLWLEFSVPLPQHDAHLVCVILGDGVDHPSIGSKSRSIGGKMERINTLFTLAATNPVYLDVDGNGRYESPRQQAQSLLRRSGKSLNEQWKAVMAADAVVAVQMVSLLRQQTEPDLRSALDGRIRNAAAERPLLAEFARHALPVETTGDTRGR
jgi:hypothetical protein